jgi:uncharacterized pyridoxamine 5'-phosphate oxidase family protein
MDEVLAFLKKVDTYYLATVEGDQPRVRAFGTINEFAGRLYIQTGRSKPVSAQIASNPKVELCAFDGEKWLRVAATLIDDSSIESQESMLAAYPELKAMYTVDDGNAQTLYLSNATATFSTFGGESRTVTF